MNGLKQKLSWILFGWPILLCASAFGAAEEGQVVFEPPEDVVLAWAERACFWVTILSVFLILWILVFRRKRLMEASSKWLLALGVAVLPVPVAFLSSGVGMEGSKEVEFCYSCHAPMDPFVNDMMNRESDTLAAKHYKNRYIQSELCWKCHSDYGIAGTAEAKTTGLLHIYKFTTNTWEAPIKLYHPYRWSICLDCHAGSALFEHPRNDPEAHDGVLEGVMAGDTGCTDCHEMAHPSREDRS